MTGAMAAVLARPASFDRLATVDFAPQRRPNHCGAVVVNRHHSLKNGWLAIIGNRGVRGTWCSTSLRSYLPSVVIVGRKPASYRGNLHGSCEWAGGRGRNSGSSRPAWVGHADIHHPTAAGGRQ